MSARRQRQSAGRRYRRRVTWRADAEDPSADEAFGRLIDAAIEALPAEVRDRLGSVAIVVDDEPTADQLASVRADGLFGLYQGIPRTRWGADAAAVPSKITIYRGPLERAFTGAALAT